MQKKHSFSYKHKSKEKQRRPLQIMRHTNPSLIDTINKHNAKASVVTKYGAAQQSSSSSSNNNGKHARRNSGSNGDGTNHNNTFNMTQQLSISEPTQSQIHICKYNTTGEYILTGGQDRTIRLWNSSPPSLEDTGRGKVQCIKSYQAHGWEVLDVTVSPENGKFASCGGDKTVFLWDVLTGSTIRRFSGPNGHTQRINTVDFNEQGTVVASGSYDSTIRLWDCRSMMHQPIQILQEPKDSVTSVSIKGTELLAGSVDGTIRVYDMRAGKIVTDQLFEPVTCVSFSKDRKCILASSLDSTLRLMDRDNGVLLNAYKGHVNSKYKIQSCLSSTDAYVLSGSEDGKVYIWDLVEGHVVNTIQAHSKIVTSIAYHPKEDRMCTASVDGSIKTWAAIQAQ